VGYLVGALCLAVAVLTIFSPGILLFLGWRDLRARRFEKADTRATLAGIASAVQFCILAPIALLMAGKNNEQSGFAILALPLTLGFFSGVLHRSIRRRRDEDREETRACRREERGGKDP
jgi:hypothetical protein